MSGSLHGFKQSKPRAAAAAAAAAATSGGKASPAASPIKPSGGKSAPAADAAATAALDSAPTPGAPPRQDYIAATVGYSYSRDTGSCTPSERRVLQHVAANYVMPAALETVAFGPLSGGDYPKRVLACFQAGTLPLKPGATPVRMCRCCGETGHWPADCPRAF